MYYLSSFHSPEGDELVTTRRSKDGTQLQLDATPTQQTYAKYISDVDRLNQNTKVNRSRKSLRWYRKVEMKLRDCVLYIDGCSHIAAVLFAMDHGTSTMKEASVTDVPAYWLFPTAVKEASVTNVQRTGSSQLL